MNITKEQIKEWLEQNIPFTKKGNFILTLKEGHEIIEQCFNDLAPKWVSVDDELPEGSMAHVLVFCEGGNIDKSFYCTDREFLSKGLSSGCYSRKRHGKNSGYFDLSHKHGYKITHWMPLPEPPK